MDNQYECFYGAKRETISAPTLYAAKEEAIKRWKVPRGKQGLISVVLVVKDGVQRSIDPGAL